MFYVARGDMKMWLDDATGALADYDRAEELTVESCPRLRARALHKLKRYEEAADSFMLALEFDYDVSRESIGVYASGLVFAANQHFNAGRAVQALAAYDKALLLEPGHAEATRWKSELLRRGDPNLKPSELEPLLAAASKEDTFAAYSALDAALAKRGRFAEIIEHWTGFLERHPAEGRAYLERGGAFMRVKQLTKAIADAEKACELGLPQGCGHAKQLRVRLAGAGAQPAP